MNHYLTDDRHAQLIEDLRAAALSGDDWRGRITEVLAVAGVMPECCREDEAEGDLEKIKNLRLLLHLEEERAAERAFRRYVERETATPSGVFDLDKFIAEMGNPAA